VTGLELRLPRFAGDVVGSVHRIGDSFERAKADSFRSFVETDDWLLPLLRTTDAPLTGVPSGMTRMCPGDGDEQQRDDPNHISHATTLD